MPVQIGAVIHNFSDPTGLLSDCHRRIETMYLHSFCRIGCSPKSTGFSNRAESSLGRIVYGPFGCGSSISGTRWFLSIQQNCLPDLNRQTSKA